MITEHAQILKKAPSWLYKIGAQLFIDGEFPRHLFVETTASCNLRCDYCPRERINNHMDFGLFRAIIDEATSHGPRSFSLHLFGEPLLYPKVWESIEYIKKKNKRHTILLTSNGTLFERFITELTGSGVDKVIWSWRPEAKFSEETKERLRKWGKLTVRMIKGVTPPEAISEWKNWPNLELRNLHNYGGNIDLLQFQETTIPSITVNNVVSKQLRWPCYHLWLAPAVAWNGNLLICCSDPHQKEVIGKFPDMSIAESWKKMHGIRQAHLEGKFEGICKDCDVWKTYPDLFFNFQKKNS